MNKWKFFLSVLSFILLALLLLLFFSFSEHFSSSSSLPAENGTLSVFFCPQDACEQQLLFHLNQTAASIDCAFYDLNLPSVIALLQEKKHNGIRVRIVVDADNKDAVSGLSFARLDTRQAYMHDKFCIFDAKEMMTGSMNPTVSDATQNNNNLVFVSSQILAKNYEDEFLSLWNGNFGADGAGAAAVPRFLFNNFTVENYFCPEDNCEQHILDILAAANTSIHFMTFSFTSDAIGDLLLEKGAANVEIAGVMEKSQNNAYSEYQRLHERFNVSWDSNPHFLHHKVFIIDNQIVITGSMNPSKNGNEKNDENILIIHEPQIAGLYEKEFALMKQETAEKENR